MELWIAAGASPTLPANAIQNAPTNQEPVVAEVSFDEIDPAAVAHARAPLAPIVAQLKKRFPDVLDYESRGSAGMVVDASLMGAEFGDEELAAMQPPSVKSLSPIFRYRHYRSFRHLYRRHETCTRAASHAHRITNSTVLQLGGMDQLESLDVFGTGVTPACLTVVEHLPKLRHFYVGETKIPADVPVPEAVKSKLLF